MVGLNCGVTVERHMYIMNRTLKLCMLSQWEIQWGRQGATNSLTVNDYFEVDINALKSSSNQPSSRRLQTELAVYYTILGNFPPTPP